MSSVHKLSELIKIKRTDRPDEWSMDRLSRLAEKLEQENQELVAHCEVLTAQFNLDYDLQDRRIIDQTPKQSLTIIQADAIEKARRKVESEFISSTHHPITVANVLHSFERQEEYLREKST